MPFFLRWFSSGLGIIPPFLALISCGRTGWLPYHWGEKAGIVAASKLAAPISFGVSGLICFFLGRFLNQKRWVLPLQKDKTYSGKTHSFLGFNLQTWGIFFITIAAWMTYQAKSQLL